MDQTDDAPEQHGIDTRDWVAKIEALPRDATGALSGLENVLNAFRAKVRSGQPEVEAEVRPEGYIALKCAGRGSYSYETARTWAEQGLITAIKVRGRWYVLQSSIDEHLQRLGGTG